MAKAIDSVKVYNHMFDIPCKYPILPTIRGSFNLSPDGGSATHAHTHTHTHWIIDPERVSSTD